MRIALHEFGKVHIDAMGVGAVGRAFRSVKMNTKYYSKVLDPLQAGVAFLPEYVDIEDGTRSALRFHVRIIDKSKLQPVGENEFLLATKEI